MDGAPVVRGSRLAGLVVVVAILCCLFAGGLSAEDFTASQPRPPGSHPPLACASGAERVRLQGLLKSWQTAYAEWESALAKIDKAKPAYDQAQAQLDQALAHERSFPVQLLGIMRGKWSPELFAAVARRDAAYGPYHAASDETERAFAALQAARSADEKLSAEISKRTCARPRLQPPTQAFPQVQAQPRPQAQPLVQPQPCRQSIVSEVFRCQ